MIYFKGNGSPFGGKLSLLGLSYHAEEHSVQCALCQIRQKYWHCSDSPLGFQDFDVCYGKSSLIVLILVFVALQYQQKINDLISGKTTVITDTLFVAS